VPGGAGPRAATLQQPPTREQGEDTRLRKPRSFARDPNATSAVIINAPLQSIADAIRNGFIDAL